MILEHLGEQFSVKVSAESNDTLCTFVPSVLEGSF